MINYEVKTISETMIKPIFSLALSGHIMGMIKERIMEETDFGSFPMLVLLGPPKTGKTAVFKAAIPDAAMRKSTIDGFREINKYSRDEGVEYMLIDDVSNTNTYAKRQQYTRILDDIGRRAYEGRSCVIALTMEEGTLRYFPESGIQRMLIADTTDFWNRENQNFTRKLRKCNQTLTELLEEFRVWFQEQEPCFAERLELHEKRHEETMEKNSRLVHITFVYRISVEYYFKFLEYLYPGVYNSMNLDIQTELDHLLAPFFEVPKTEEIRRSDLFEQCFGLVLGQGVLAIQKPMPLAREMCKKYVYGDCLNCESIQGYRFSRDCDVVWHYEEVANCYNPADLVIRKNYNALFLEDACYIREFPKHLRDKGYHPLLLINREVLLDQINRALYQICRMKNRQIRPFNYKEMTDCLYRLNRVLLLPNGANSNRYSIPHRYEEVDFEGYCSVTGVSVLLIRLTQEEALLLAKRTNVFSPEAFQQEYAKRMSEILRKYWFSLLPSLGEIGEYYEF